MTIGGDLTQRGSVSSFNTSDSFKTVLNGSGLQTVDFRNSDSGLNIAEFINPNVVFTGSIRGFMLDSDAVISNDISLTLYGTLTLGGHSLTFDKDLELSGGGTIDLTDSVLNVGGSLSQSGSSVTVANGALNIGEDYSMSSGSSLKMKNADGRVNVAGSFLTASNNSHSGLLTNGMRRLLWISFRASSIRSATLIWTALWISETRRRSSARSRESSLWRII